MKTEKIAMYLSIVTSVVIISWIGIQINAWYKEKKKLKLVKNEGEKE